MLDPLHQQASYAEELLDFWMEMFENDEDYAARIKRHYEELRAEIGSREVTPGPRWNSREASRRLVGPRSMSERKERRRRLARAGKRK